MKIFKQLSIIIGISLLGDVLTELFSLPIPGSIVGMLVLLLLLLTGVIKESQIKETADFLLQNMAFFFVPACVGIMGSYYLFEGSYLQALLVIICSTILVMSVTALVTQWFIKYSRNKDERIKQ